MEIRPVIFAAAIWFAVFRLYDPTRYLAATWTLQSWLHPRHVLSVVTSWLCCLFMMISLYCTVSFFSRWLSCKKNHTHNPPTRCYCNYDYHRRKVNTSLYDVQHCVTDAETKAASVQVYSLACVRSARGAFRFHSSLVAGGGKRARCRSLARCLELISCSSVALKNSLAGKPRCEKAGLPGRTCLVQLMQKVFHLKGNRTETLWFDET